jgi:membrane-associated HD superfamily phosphohydrolase
LKAVAEAQSDYDNTLQERIAKQEQYAKVLKTCETLLAKAQDMRLEYDEILNPLRFAIEQINTCSNEWKANENDYYERQLTNVKRQGFQKYKNEIIKSLKGNIKYHDEELQKSKIAIRKRVEAFETFSNFIKENIKQIENGEVA